jgi:hypothetical protein
MREPGKRFAQDEHALRFELVEAIHLPCFARRRGRAMCRGNSRLFFGFDPHSFFRHDVQSRRIFF